MWQLSRRRKTDRGHNPVGIGHSGHLFFLFRILFAAQIEQRHCDLARSAQPEKPDCADRHSLASVEKNRRRHIGAGTPKKSAAMKTAQGEAKTETNVW